MSTDPTIPEGILMAARRLAAALRPEAARFIVDGHGDDLYFVNTIAKAIHDAVMAEGERCAAVVESFAPGGWNYEYGHDDASMRVAIRGAILADPKSEG